MTIISYCQTIKLGIVSWDVLAQMHDKLHLQESVPHIAPCQQKTAQPTASKKRIKPAKSYVVKLANFSAKLFQMLQRMKLLPHWQKMH